MNRLYPQQQERKKLQQLQQQQQETMVVIGAGVGIASAGYGIYSGLHKEAQAKKALAAANASRPMEKTPQALLDNQAMAQQNSNTGLPSAQYNVAMQNIKNQQMQALSGSADRRGGLALLGQIQAQGNSANSNLDAANSAQRVKNDQTLMGVNSEVGQYQDKSWQNNYNDKYKNDYNYAMGLLGSGNANVVSGIDQLGATAIRSANTYGMQQSAKNNNNNGGFGNYNWGGGTTSGGMDNSGMSDDSQYV